MADVLMLTISGNASGLLGAVNQAEGALNRMESAAQKSSGILGSVFSGIGQGVGIAAGLTGINGIAGALGAVGSAAIGMNSKLEQAQIGFTSMLGSGEKASAFLKDLQQFANTTPFEFPGLLQASQRMLAFGFAAKDVRPLLTAVGSAAAAMGGGQEGINRITLALGQMKAATVVQLGELNQLTEAGVPAFDLLAKSMGITTGEVKKLVSQGKIASDVFINAFQEWAKANFGDMMEQQSHTFEGAMSTIHDTLISTGARAFQPFFALVSQGADTIAQFTQTATFTGWADAVAGTITDVVRQLGDAFRTVQQVIAGDWSPDASKIEPFANMVGIAAVAVRDFIGWVDRLPAPVKAAALGFAAVVVAAGPISGILGAVGAVLGTVAAAFAFLLTPLGLVAIAVGALAAAWSVNLGGIQEKTEAVIGIVGPAFLALVPIVQQALGGDIAGAFSAFLTLVGSVADQLAPLLAAWGQEFVEWVGPMIPPFLAAVADIGLQLLAWIAAQIPPLMAQLTLWGQQFVAWVAPMIPPLLEAATALGAALLAWIAAEIPPLTAQLLLWGQEFVAWVAPQIPLMNAELIVLGKALIDWITAQVPIIVPELTKWGLLFGAWVLTTAIPEMAKGLLDLRNTLVQWAMDTGAALAPNMIALGKALVAGIWQGIKEAAAEIGPNVMGAVRGMFSGAAPGTTGVSGAGDRGDFDAKAIAAARRHGLEDPTGFAAQLRQESGNYDPEVVSGRRKSSAGATGIAQFMPDTATRYGIDPNDPDAAIEAAARYMADLKGQYGSQQEAAAHYYGAPGANSQEGRYYLNAVENQRKNVRMPTASVPQVSQFALGLPPDEAMAACGPAALAWFMNQTGRTPTGQQAEQLAAASGWDKQRGMYGPAAFGNALTGAGISNVVDTTPTRGEVGALAAAGTPFAISTSGTTDEFGQSRPGHYFQVQGGSPEGLNVGLSGTALRCGSSVMSLDQIMAMTGPMNAIITLSGQMGDALTTAGQTGGAAFDGLLASATTMADGSTLTVTQMGTDVTATITDAAGQVTGQWTTMTTGVADQTAALATGVPEQTAAMSAGVLTSVTDLGSGVLTTMQDMSGTTIATVTDMTGQVTSQSATLANGVSLNMSEMATNGLVSVTSLGDGTMTVMQDTSGNAVATITNMQGQVTGQYTTMATAGGSAVTQLANTSKTQFAAIGQAADATKGPIDSFKNNLTSIPKPDFSGIVAEFHKVTSAAQTAAEAINNVEKHKGGVQNDKGGLGAKAAGGPVFSGEAYRVGELGPELFVPYTNGTIIPNNRLSGGGGGTTIVINVNVAGSLTSERDLVEAVRDGLIGIGRRNASDVLSGSVS